MALAEKSGVKYRLDSDDSTALMDMDDGDADEEEAMLVAKAKNIADVARRKKARAGGNVPEGVLPESIVEKIEELPELSLLEKQQDTMEEPTNDSLLARGEEE